VLRVGLTGGVGAGKTTVAVHLAELGAVVVDADRVAREVVRPGSEGLAAVTDAFGRSVLAADGSLDRKVLAAVVFADEAARLRLNRIVHPLVRARTEELLARAPEDAIVVNEVPLLVENGLGDRYHLVIVVEAPEDERVGRLVGGRGMAAEDVRRRIRAQADPSGRRAAADVALDNTGDVGALRERVDALWRRRLVPFEENLRHVRCAVRPERPDLVPTDPDGAAAARRVARRITAAAAAAGVEATVRHVGATALPATVGRDVLDLVLAVRSPGGRAGSGAALGAALDAAGFPAVPVEEGDDPAGRCGEDGTCGPPRCSLRNRRGLRRGADPGRPVDLWIRGADDQGLRSAVLLRDRLRGDATARAALAAVKEQALATSGDPAAYQAAKDAWFAARGGEGTRDGDPTGAGRGLVEGHGPGDGGTTG